MLLLLKAFTFSFLVSVVSLLAVSVGVREITGVQLSMSNLEFFAVMTTYACVYLCVVQSRWNYAVGIVCTLLYSLLFFRWEAYGLALFNLYLVASQAYGWWRWGPDRVTRPVTRLKVLDYPGYLAFGIVLAISLLTLMLATGYQISFIDQVLTIGSGVAQLLLDNKRRETWIVWAVVDALSVYFLLQANEQGEVLYLAATQSGVLFVNAVWGWVSWGQTMKEPENVGS